jgi:hypothetical protein
MRIMSLYLGRCPSRKRYSLYEPDESVKMASDALSPFYYTATGAIVKSILLRAYNIFGVLERRGHSTPYTTDGAEIGLQSHLLTVWSILML